MDLKVIGAGVGRTGTTSTKAALEELGFGPCYTYATMFSRLQDADFWLDAYAGKPVNWDDVFATFHSVVDWPACDFLDQLMVLNPDARVVLNVRDPEKWYESMVNTIWMVRQAEARVGIDPDSNSMSRLREVMLWERAFEGKFEDKQHSINFFKRFNQQVIDRVPSKKLLVFDVTQGWEPLCGFLGMPIPDHPFPRLNDTPAFQELVRKLMPHTVAAS